METPQIKTNNPQDQQLLNKYRGMNPQQRAEFRKNQQWKQQTSNASAVEEQFDAIDAEPKKG